MEVYIVNITNYIKGDVDGKKVIISCQNAVMQVFESPTDAKIYIDEYFRESALENAVLESKVKKNGGYKATLKESFVGGSSKQRLSDGSILVGCTEYHIIEVYPMNTIQKGCLDSSILRFIVFVIVRLGCFLLLLCGLLMCPLAQERKRVFDKLQLPDLSLLLSDEGRSVFGNK